jgi:nucleoside-diphosphate-sugar epimerase
MDSTTATADGRQKPRVFLAGASGVIGQRLIPQLVEAGYEVGGMTRSAGKADLIAELGAEPIVCDVFDRDSLIEAIVDFQPDVILSQLTDLPDDVTRIPEHGELNARIRTEGTQNLIDAGRQCGGSPKVLAQSVAWDLPDPTDAASIGELEKLVLGEDGVVLRYGQFYGPGTYNEGEKPGEPRVSLDRAAARTVEALSEAGVVITVTDD